MPLWNVTKVCIFFLVTAMVAKLAPDGGEGMIDIPNLEFHYLRSYNKNVFVKGRNNL